MSPEEKKPILSLRLLAISATIYVIALIIGIFGSSIGISIDNQWNIIIAMLITALTLNVVGLIKGFSERKKNFESSVDGVVGNLIPILLFLILIGVVIYYASKLGPLLN